MFPLQTVLAGRTLCLHPSSRIARENLEVFCDTWAQSVNELSRLAKESDAICYGRVAAEKQAYMSLPKPGVNHQRNRWTMSSSNLYLSNIGGTISSGNHFWSPTGVLDASPRNSLLPPHGTGRTTTISSIPLHAMPSSALYYGSLDSVFVNVCTPEPFARVHDRSAAGQVLDNSMREEMRERKAVKNSLTSFEKSVSRAVESLRFRPSSPSLFDCSPISLRSSSFMELSPASYYSSISAQSLPNVAAKKPYVEPAKLERQLDKAVEEMIKNMA